MKKKILLMVALCTTIMSLAACGSDDKKTNGVEPTAPAIEQDVDTKEDVTASTTPDKAETPDVTGTEKPVTTPETTETPIEAPVDTLTWENSGLSYEVIATANMAATDINTVANNIANTLYIVKVTNNHNDNTYYINNKNSNNIHIYYNNCYLAPGNTYEFIFATKDYADAFVNNITSIKDTAKEYVTVKTPDFNKYNFAPEIDCTITNNANNITISYNKKSWYFENGMPETSLIEMTGIIPTTALHFYDANNLVGVYVLTDSDDFCMYENIDIQIIPDVTFDKITAITFGQW